MLQWFNHTKKTPYQCFSEWNRLRRHHANASMSSLRHEDIQSMHYCDVIMGKIASQITSLTIVYSAVYSGTDQRKHQSSASLAFVRGIHRGPVNSPHKWPVTRKMFPFDDVIMVSIKWSDQWDIKPVRQLINQVKKASWRYFIEFNSLTRWGRVTHICVSNLTITVSDNGLSPGRRKAIIGINAGILLIWPLRTNFSEIFIEIHIFSAQWRHFLSRPQYVKRTSCEWFSGLNRLRKHSANEYFIESNRVNRYQLSASINLKGRENTKQMLERIKQAQITPYQCLNKINRIRRQCVTAPMDQTGQDIMHYGDVIMSAIASQITSLTIYSIVYSDADQRKHQSSASLAFVRGIHQGTVNSPHKLPVTRKMFPFDDVIMASASMN